MNTYEGTLRRLLAQPLSRLGLSARHELVHMRWLVTLLDEGGRDLLSRTWIWEVRSRIAARPITLESSAMISLLDAMMMKLLDDPGSARIYLARAMWLSSVLGQAPGASA